MLHKLFSFHFLTQSIYAQKQLLLSTVFLLGEWLHFVTTRDLKLVSLGTFHMDIMVTQLFEKCIAFHERKLYPLLREETALCDNILLVMKTTHPTPHLPLNHAVSSLSPTQRQPYLHWQHLLLAWQIIFLWAVYGKINLFKYSESLHRD